MPPPAAVVDIAAGYGNDLELLTAYAVAQVDQRSPALAGGNTDRWHAAVVDAGPTLLELQHAGVQQADPYLDDVLTAQGADTAADARVATETFVDQTDGGGSWLRNLVYAPPSAYQDAVRAGAGANLATARARFVAGAIVSGGMRDMARSAIGVSSYTRGSVKGYVRALRGVSCARCAVLAGRHYHRSAFQRHPQCDCYMIPTTRDTGGWATDPRAYFNRLSSQQQNAVFGGAADAIRAGANIAQSVNAFDGVTTVAGYTTAGTTKRGLAGQRLRGKARLLPDEIMAQAEANHWTRERTLAELYKYGYIV